MWNVFDVSPSVVMTTTGTDDFGAGALPSTTTVVVDEESVVVALPSKETSDPVVKPTPLTVRVKLPGCTCAGLTDMIVGSGMIVTADEPLDDGEAVLVARTVTVAGFGTASGER